MQGPRCSSCAAALTRVRLSRRSALAFAAAGTHWDGRRSVGQPQRRQRNADRQPGPDRAPGRAVQQSANDFYSVVHLDHGDALAFDLRNGQTRSLELIDSGLDLFDEFGVSQWTLWMEVAIAGHRHRVLYSPFGMQALGDPLVVNGMRMGLDYVGNLPGKLGMPIRGPVAATHGHDVRLWVSDANQPVLPNAHEWFQLFQDRDGRQLIGGAVGDPWTQRADYRIRWDRDVRLSRPKLAIAENKTGYLGLADYGIHTGIDIATPDDVPLYAVIDGGEVLPDTEHPGQYAYRVTRTNGDTWEFGTNHCSRRVVPVGSAVNAGTEWARTGHAGTSQRDPHAHCLLTVTEAATGNRFGLNPWPAMWQGLENRKDRDRFIRARIGVVGPVEPGATVTFSSEGSRSGPGRDLPSYRWHFSDGSTSSAAHPSVRFARPGMHQAILVVDDGRLQALDTIFFTVGEPGFRAPVVTLGAWNSPAMPRVGGTIQFGVTAESGSGSQLEYEWDFGDGTKAAGRTVTHQYRAPGRYAAVVTIRDNATEAVRLDSVLVDTWQWPDQ